MNLASESVRPAWTINNPGAFTYWMRTGADELPADLVDDGDIPNAPAMRSERETSRLMAILDELQTGGDES
jgi:hypothetical protein